MNGTNILRWLAATAGGLSFLVMCGCQGLQQNSGATGSSGSITSVNHIIFMAQENRSFDTYFGQLPAYWAANGYPAQQLNGLPTNASNPSVSGTTTSSTIPAYHIQTECIENLTPSWDESHLDFNLNNPTSTTATLDGFVYNAVEFGNAQSPPYTDTTGMRAMGYYDWTDLPYYYFMASNFATSDNWFSPALDRTQVNRLYLMAGTSHGYAYPPGSNTADALPLSVPTIFDALQTAGVSWKIYTTDNNCGPNSNQPCTYLTQFAKYASGDLPANVVPATPNFFNDVANGTLPSVAFIEGGYTSALDEHPDNNVQQGAAYVASLINALMGSPSWSDSAFILTYDEGGGLFDHVAPQPAVNPDGIMPVDLDPGDICNPIPSGANNCQFNYTGFRVPLVVVSPFTKKNYVSHTAADYTAILKFIETRFNVPSLTQRDAAQMDMTEFFDFQNVPWATPPTPPSQPTSGTCNYQNLQ
jgi:phospholipase C